MLKGIIYAIAAGICSRIGLREDNFQKCTHEQTLYKRKWKGVIKTSP